MNVSHSKARTLAEFLRDLDYHPSREQQVTAADELLRLDAENAALQAGYTASRLEIASLQAKIAASAEAPVAPAKVGEYPPLPDPFLAPHEEAGCHYPATFSADQMHDYADLTCKARGMAAAALAQKGHL